jgi:adenosylcobinamide-GDP ribazoletransferase
MFDNNGQDQPARATEPRDPATAVANFIIALRFLTRLPVGGLIVEDRSLSHAMAAFPVVGLLVGLLSAVALLLAHALGLGPLAAAAIAVGTHVVVTGALHEDGLADTADGFWGGDTPQRRLAIMRDSRIGTFGVLALLIAVVLKCALIAELLAVSAGGAVASLAAAGAVSRHAMVALMSAGEPARHDGLAFSAGKPSSEARRVSLILAVGIAVVLLWGSLGLLAAILALVLAQGAVAGITVLARRKTQGYTGDICGAAQQISEIAVLAGAAMTAG